MEKMVMETNGTQEHNLANEYNSDILIDDEYYTIYFSDRFVETLDNSETEYGDRIRQFVWIMTTFYAGDSIINKPDSVNAIGAGDVIDNELEYHFSTSYDVSKNLNYYPIVEFIEGQRENTDLQSMCFPLLYNDLVE